MQVYLLLLSAGVLLWGLHRRDQQALQREGRWVARRALLPRDVPLFR